MTKTLSIIIGSTRTNRAGAAIANWITAHAGAAGFEKVELIDLKEINLPKFDAAMPPMAAPVTTPEARAWGEVVANTEHLLILTPEYNRSIPSDLKAAIDILFEEWAGKPTAIISYGFIEGGKNAGLHLRDSLTHLKTDLVEESAAIQLSETLISDGSVQDAEVNDDTENAVTATLAALASK